MSQFKPHLSLLPAHIQTIYPTLFANREKLVGEVEIFELSDGDFVEVVWKQKPNSTHARPIVVLFHGLGGSFYSPYIQEAMRFLAGHGYDVVVMQFRGCGKEPNRLPRAYHSGDTADAKAWIEYLHSTYHDRDIFAVGYSLGGNMLLKLLGEWGEDSLVKAAISISAPMQLESSAKKINSGFSKLYQFNMMRELKKQLKKKYHYHDMQSLIGISRDEVDNLRTFWEFDAVYTAPLHGFINVHDYYQKASSKQYLKKITTPTLIIHALDDPFMGQDVVPKKEEISSVIELEVSQYGGHVGFVEGRFWQPEYWLPKRVENYLSKFRV